MSILPNELIKVLRVPLLPLIVTFWVEPKSVSAFALPTTARPWVSTRATALAAALV